LITGLPDSSVETAFATSAECRIGLVRVHANHAPSAERARPPTVSNVTFVELETTFSSETMLARVSIAASPGCSTRARPAAFEAGAARAAPRRRRGRARRRKRVRGGERGQSLGDGLGALHEFFLRASARTASRLPRLRGRRLRGGGVRGHAAHLLGHGPGLGFHGRGGGATLRLGRAVRLPDGAAHGRRLKWTAWSSFATDCSFGASN